MIRPPNLLAAALVVASVTGCSLAVVPRAKEVAALTGKSSDGVTIYSSDCRGCHGADGRGGERSVPDASPYRLTGAAHALSAPETVTVIIQGAGKMPSFARYTDQQLADVYAYIMALPN